jgi:fatty-acyl-CoA synthase
LAVVVPKAGMQVDTDDIRRHVKASADDGAIPKYAVPERVLVVDEIVRTSVGKLDKKKLRQQYADAS